MANALTSAMDTWLERAAIIYQNEAEIIRIHVIYDIVSKVFV